MTDDVKTFVAALRTRERPSFVPVGNFVPIEVVDEVNSKISSLHQAPLVICDGKTHSWTCNPETCPSMKEYLCSLCDTPKIKNSDSLKQFAMSITPGDLMTKRCLAEDCFNLGKCIQQTTIIEVYDLQTNFWGTDFYDNPKAKQRRVKIEDWFARSHYNTNKQFEFILPSTRRVCERAVLALLGLSLHSQLSRAPLPWLNARREKIEFLSTASGEVPLSKVKKVLFKEDGRRLKFQEEDCIAFIAGAIDMFKQDGQELTTAETTPYGKTTSQKDKDEEDDDHLVIIPYEDIQQFYQEFVDVKKAAESSGMPVPSKSTFLRAWNTISKDQCVRLLRCKGAFKGCDLCNQCNALLRNKGHKWTSSMLDIVLKFKRYHLKQQQEARIKLALDIEAAKSSIGIDGQPKVAFIEPDGVSTWLGNTPKVGFGTRRGADNSKAIQNRTIGVDVVCGKIEGKLLYHFDNYFGHGANIIIEVLRQAQEDLSRLLKEQGLLMPRTLKLQFDNCGENKNKVTLIFLICSIFLVPFNKTSILS